MSSASQPAREAALAGMRPFVIFPAAAEPRRPPVPDYQPFPTHVLPAPFDRFACAAAEAIGCDQSFVALPLLAAAGAAIGATRRIEVKRGWVEPAIIWAAMVADSGQLKTPALKAAIRPFEQREIRANREFEHDQQQHGEAMRVYKLELQAWNRARRQDDQTPMPEEPERPVHRRYLVEDITLEAVADRLAANPRGLLLACDELSGWLGSFNQYKGGRGADASRWLSAFGGQTLRVDRKNAERPTIIVSHPHVSICGGIQPRILRKALGTEHFENGLAARFLLAMPPRRPRHWTNDDLPDDEYRRVNDVFRRLWTLEPASNAEGETFPHGISLLPPARARFAEFVDTHGEEQVGLTGDLMAAWSKLEAYAARLTLVIHFVRWANREGAPVNEHAVDLETIERAIALVEWFKNEATRVYQILAESESETARRDLIELIGRRGGRITVRQLMQASRQYRGSAVEAEHVLMDLVEAGFAHRILDNHDGQGGRPVEVFVLNCETATQAAEQASQQDPPACDRRDLTWADDYYDDGDAEPEFDDYDPGADAVSPISAAEPGLGFGRRPRPRRA